MESAGTDRSSEKRRERLAMTDRGIAKLVAPARGRLEVLDTKMPGLALRVAPSGKKTWTVVWHQRRQTRRYAFATYPADQRTFDVDVLETPAEVRHRFRIGPETRKVISQ